MADRGLHVVAVSRTAIALLLAGALLHYGWAWAPAANQADVWNLAGAAARLGLLVTVLWHHRGITLAVGAWWAAEEVLVIGCSSWHIIAPWPRVAGQAQCDALLHYDLGTLGLLAVALLVVNLSRLTGSQTED